MITVALYRTRWGLRVRAVGEHPSAADTVGINVMRTRYRAVLLGGAVAGFGGTFFTLQSGTPFQENMTNGQGLHRPGRADRRAAGTRWAPSAPRSCSASPRSSRGACRRCGSPIPSEFLRMAPYLVTLVVVAGLIGRARPPAADGQPYKR